MTKTALYSMGGYLDNLSRELRGEKADDSESEYDDKFRDANKLEKDQVDRYGVGSWDSFVDFNEFDGGDGQMGVAGDGKQGLDAEWDEKSIAKSRSMSAKVAWGKSTGYADQLREQGVETSRAQQMENWMNQQELQKMRTEQRYMTEVFDNKVASAEEDWRQLSKFGVERNQKFDLDQTLGAVTPGSTIYHHIQLQARLNRPEIFEFNILNSFMGYSDFRARFTPETGADWTVEPAEGSLNGKTGVDFTVKYRPSNPGTSTGYLVIQTEDDKWTFQVTGQASM
ncbi:hypothetical protein ACA910_015739 [Epithemia clementina (nom. ined.)]